MLTIAKIKNGAGYKQHVSNNDYYEEGKPVPGQWMGHGAEKLGLTGEVDLDHFKAVGEGRDPKTREPLRQRKNVDRLRSREIDGKQIVEEYKAVNFYDCTISAPKDVSILAMIDPRVAQWHREAALETARRIESGALAAVRKGGVCESRVTSNLVIAAYHHDTSRALDTNLHTHLAVANLTYDGAEGIWKALSAYQIFEQVDLYTEIYRNELAAKVMGGGYRIEDHVKDGKDNGFGIVGISEATREKFSRRSAQRDAAIAEFRAAHGGREPTKNEVRRLVRETREDKLISITTDEVKARQWARLDPDERHTLDSLHREALERGSIREHAPAGPSLSYAAEHVFERVSVAAEPELKTEALRHGRGRIDLDELRGALLAETATGNMLTARGKVATQETLDRERGMVAMIDAGVDKFKPLGRGRAFVPSDRLRAEQKEALRAVLASRDLAFNLSGSAGVGKTTLLQEVHRGLTEARRSVVAVAPTAKAVEELREVGFQNAVTIARLLNDPQQQHELAGQVLIVDEAGMVSTKDMTELIGLAKSSGARIVFSGDTAQIKSVEAGDALRVLERESKMHSFALREVVRQ